MRLRVTNRYDFLSLEHLSVKWRLRSSATGMTTASGADSSLAGGQLDVADIAPGESRELSVEDGPAAAVAATAAAVAEHGRQRGVGMEWDVGGELGEFFLHVEARLVADSAWAPAGHLIAWECIPMSGLIFPPSRPLPPVPVPPSAMARPGAAPELAAGAGEGVGGGGDASGGATLETVVQPSPGFIAYEDASASSSREESPLGQL